MDTLESIVEASPLQPHEKEAFLNALVGLEDSDKYELVDLFTIKPQIIPILYLNLVSKTIAVSKGDSSRFQKIVSKEKEILESIEN